ncbi:hypothetical protein GH714_024125 [Hevea brasiliensis]|uniref:Uncharacterized protein n=1 Tax=Hevea brasiliensis TaxID=3981 RepID=A0A6A6LAJ8_HEVBR|nr:hypothetical protein GH714_024125 [Hevea brasiliensis]
MQPKPNKILVAGISEFHCFHHLQDYEYYSEGIGKGVVVELDSNVVEKAYFRAFPSDPSGLGHCGAAVSKILGNQVIK